MDVSLGLSAKVVIVGSGLAFTILGLGAIKGDFIGGLFFICPLLLFIWACIFKLTVFLSEGDGIDLPIPGYPSSKSVSEPDDEEISDSVPEAGEIYARADGPRGPRSPASRIIGEDARRRVGSTEGAAYRRGPVVHSGPSKPRKPTAEDRDFADFLRSSPF